MLRGTRGNNGARSLAPAAAARSEVHVDVVVKKSFACGGPNPKWSGLDRCRADPGLKK